jgi:predicted DNA repair protein MutK
MPSFLTLVSAVGTAAMIWVGGGIIVHGLEAYGLSSIGEAIHAAAAAAAKALSPVAGVIEWIVTAAGSALVGLLIGALLIPVIGFVVAPAWKVVKGFLPISPR